MAHSYRLGFITWVYQVQISVGTDICDRGCAYTVLQTVQRHGTVLSTFPWYISMIQCYTVPAGVNIHFRWHGLVNTTMEMYGRISMIQLRLYLSVHSAGQGFHASAQVPNLSGHTHEIRLKWSSGQGLNGSRSHVHHVHSLLLHGCTLHQLNYRMKKYYNK